MTNEEIEKGMAELEAMRAKKDSMSNDEIVAWIKAHAPRCSPRSFLPPFVSKHEHLAPALCTTGLPLCVSVGLILNIVFSYWRRY